VESGEGITLTGLYIEGGLWEINEGLIPSRYIFIIFNNIVNDFANKNIISELYRNQERVI
jgi:hypothetical protein